MEKMMLDVIHTDKAPAAIGSYSQAIKANDTVYLSGQIPLDPATLQLVDGDSRVQVIRVFENLKSVAEAAGGNMDSIVRITVYLIDLSQVTLVNEIMKKYFKIFPARTTIGVSALPKGSSVEIDAIMVMIRKS
jgi:reactive intermediate/imine deaminase